MRVRIAGTGWALGRADLFQGRCTVLVAAIVEDILIGGYYVGCGHIRVGYVHIAIGCFRGFSPIFAKNAFFC